jgi:hypothetical protein
VAISPEHVQLACGYQDGRRRLVLSLEVEVFLSPPDCLALRLHKVRAGAVPLPRTKVLDEVGRAVKGSDLPIEWRETDGDPVALIHLTDAQADSKRLVRLESLTLEAGRIVVVGRTERAGSLNPGSGADDAEPPPLARRDPADGPRHDGRSGSARQQ